MRLICPNCGAQYEVDARLIPPAGRDLECSNCGHAWFERPGASEAAEAEDEALATEIAAASRDRAAAPPPEVTAPARAEAPAPEAEDVAEPAEDASPALESREPEPAEAPLVAADLDPEADETPQEDETPAAAPPEHFAGQPDEAEPIPSVEGPEEGAHDPATDGGRRMPLRTVAPEIAEILRQEAEREQAARRAEAEAGIETQPDLGLDQLMADEERRAAEARERLARLRGTPSPDPAPSASTPAPATPVTAPQTPFQDDESELPVAPSRRGLLPDIEEINSTLSSAPERPTSTAEAEEERRRGFRLGFGSILLVAALLALAYAFAPEIVATVPQTEPVLAPYVSTIDEARLWLDLRLQDLLNRMEAPPDGG